MKLVTATPNSLYCDTSEVLTPAKCKLLRSNGIRGVWRYLSGLRAMERDLILSSGLELFFVNYAHMAGWIPSTANGLSDGKRDLQAVQSLDIPMGVHVAYDLEGPSGTALDVMAHVIAHAGVLKSAFVLPALYVGEGSLLTSAQLYALPSVLYWKSCSSLRDGASGLVPLCEYSVVQGRPFNVMLDDGKGTTVGTTVTIDFDYVQKDLKGRLPIGVTA